MAYDTEWTRTDSRREHGQNSYIVNADEINSLISQQIVGSGMTVGTSAVPIGGGLTRRRTILIQNNDASADLYIGGTGVTTSNGIKLIAGNMIEIAMGPNISLYGISTTNINVRVAEFG